MRHRFAFWIFLWSHQLIKDWRNIPKGLSVFNFPWISVFCYFAFFSYFFFFLLIIIISLSTWNPRISQKIGNFGLSEFFVLLKIRLNFSHNLKKIIFIRTIFLSNWLIHKPSIQYLKEVFSIWQSSSVLTYYVTNPYTYWKKAMIFEHFYN